MCISAGTHTHTHTHTYTNTHIVHPITISWYTSDTRLRCLIDHEKDEGTVNHFPLTTLNSVTWAPQTNTTGVLLSLMLPRAPFSLRLMINYFHQ